MAQEVRLWCPHCGKRLRAPETTPLGQRFRCPRCHRPFNPAAGDFATAPPSRSAVLVAQPHAPPADPTSEVSKTSEVGDELPVATAALGAPASVPEPALSDSTAAGNKAFLLIASVTLVLLGAGIGLTLLLAPDGGAEGEITQAAPSAANGQGNPDEGPPRKEGDGGAAPGQETPRPATPSRLVSLPPEKQAKVNRAIARGVEFLKRQQRLGAWKYQKSHTPGLTALAALTLLECDVPPDDPAVRRAAAFLRFRLLKETQTYDISLGLLLLDRLGDPRDRRLIQRLALRLIAGQRPSGGWVYTCPLLDEAEQRQLFAALRELPSDPLLLFERDRGDASMESFLPKLGAGGGTPRRRAPPSPPRPRPPDSTIAAAFDELPLEKVRADDLPGRLKFLPAVRPLPSARELPARDETDNSNTQFATLGLWAAGRHGVPTERSLALLVKRFRRSQNDNGSWGYNYGTSGDVHGLPAMTCAGLLGLAVGHGLIADSAARNPVADDPCVREALQALSWHIGKPLKRARGGKRPKRAPVNAYFLWSVERVGVLYDLPTIGDKDWYSWGVELILNHQRGDGGWHARGYPGSTAEVDTCFALLFLKRANLAKDLTRKLDFFDAGNKK